MSTDEKSFEERFLALAAAHPKAPLEWATWVLTNRRDVTWDGRSTPGNPLPPPNSPLEAYAEYAFEHPEIMDLMASHRKIEAIKLLLKMAHRRIGLKQAKEAVELADSWFQAGRSPRAEREQVERDAQEAIESIKRAMQGAAS